MNKTKNKNNELNLKQLLSTDPKLTPKELSKLFPEYKEFHPIAGSYGLWTPKKKLKYLKTNFGKHRKIILLISGISAGGKDAVRKKIQKLEPGFLFKAVTATTREIRNNEKNKVDYYFYDEDEFSKEAKKERFIEHTNFGGKHYGSPKRSFDDALLRSEPIVCSHVEMRDGWPGVEKYFDEEYQGEKPFILKIFVMPKMKFSEYAHGWLPRIREDWKARLGIAAWEISVAAKNADIILTNTILKNTSKPLTKHAQEIIKLTQKILESTPSTNQVRSLHK